jgi:hypothetical protein
MARKLGLQGLQADLLEGQLADQAGGQPPALDVFALARLRERILGDAVALEGAREGVGARAQQQRHAAPRLIGPGGGLARWSSAWSIWLRAAKLGSRSSTCSSASATHGGPAARWASPRRRPRALRRPAPRAYEAVARDRFGGVERDAGDAHQVARCEREAVERGVGAPLGLAQVGLGGLDLQRRRAAALEPQARHLDAALGERAAGLGDAHLQLGLAHLGVGGGDVDVGLEEGLGGLRGRELGALARLHPLRPQGQRVGLGALHGALGVGAFERRRHDADGLIGACEEGLERLGRGEAEGRDEQRRQQAPGGEGVRHGRTSESGMA